MCDSDDLAAHTQAVHLQLEMLGLPPANWPARATGPDGEAMVDVLVIGAGMYGIAAAGALTFKGIRNIEMLDQAPAGREGPWLTIARMTTLRSPKQLPGVALGIPGLTFRAWYEARYGRAAWVALYKIFNADWMDYLTWVRTTLALPVRNGVTVRLIRPAAAHVEVQLDDGRVRHARRVVVATGRPGAGGMSISDFVDRGLWPDRAAHTGEMIAFEALRGKRIAVIGAGASAWDNAATALEHGAADVTMLVRRSALPQVNKGRGSGKAGFFEGWPALPDAERWRLLVYLHDLQAPPPHETVLRTIAQPNFRIRLATAVLSARRTAEGVALTVQPADAPPAEETADFLILGTGFAVNLAAQPEFADFLPDLATWADVYTPPLALRRDELGFYPYLGPAFELTERAPARRPALSRVHLFSHAAFASMGAIASDIPGVSIGAERLASRIAQAFFRDDAAKIRTELEAFDEPELENTPFFVPRRKV